MTVAEIAFDSAEKSIVVDKIQRYFDREMHQEIGQFEAEFLLDFFAKEVGSYFYNKGLKDAQAVLQAKLAEIDDALYDIEMPTDFVK
jgi:uncharacterized protein (DUF2164 family)